ncbi:MAG TPA: phosphoadenylyl-sulfate reductase [Steroidobacteraceae bacterium]|jgi:phosphoadenosine phosphosulfate reductase|nr:phosphoadenylyl-sulfate reductase [Steroidobacteraceae bacterium]
MNIKAQLSRLWANEFSPKISPELAELNGAIEPLPAAQRVERALELLPGEHVLTSSFGAQSAVMLHLVNEVNPGVTVVLLDTGYLFPETYSFIDELTERLKLNLKVFRAESSSAWQETRFGKLWDQGLAGIERYNRINKQEPLDRALNELHAGTWFAGLRRTQATTRSQIFPIEFKRGRYKVHPLFDWSDRDIGHYLEKHRLPYHPLWKQGYVSIGDWHTTRSLAEVKTADELRFFGLKRECGLHE